ncbi:WbqC family protein [Pedobacter duraquae]|uniref:WbqC-like protein n=1 Tax=Pedobacter duraquae TaxID=425511 RepID=A0A4R6IHK3_9SPHI|nr:WbqC family protein [Pedobacter duraquae]TDO20625.1 WbqC-like protein [Pedobacter duraquae]
MQSPALFPLFYLPPVSYFSALSQHDYIFELEKFEHFPKQTFRNRATVVSPNGPLNLFLPVVKGSKFHTTMKDVRISYDFKWQRLHWLTLQTCYRNSAYFEYYEDDFAGFFEKQHEFLFDHNLEIMDWLFKQLKKKVDFQFTTEFVKDPEVVADYRDRSMFKTDAAHPAKPYFQVFDDRNGFLPNMSIVDLLFNQGPQSKSFL